MPLGTRVDRRSFMKIGATIGAGLVLPDTGATELTRSPAFNGHLLIRDATVLTMEPGIAALLETDVLIRNSVITALGKTWSPQVLKSSMPRA